MRTLIISIAQIIFSSFSYAQTSAPDCAKFRTGRFQYIDSSWIVTIKRTKNIQEELVIKTGLKTRFKINWVEDCAYEIKQVWTNRKADRKKNGSVTRVNIIKTYENRYDYTCACKDSTNVRYRGTMYMIK